MLQTYLAHRIKKILGVRLDKNPICLWDKLVKDETVSRLQKQDKSRSNRIVSKIHNDIWAQVRVMAKFGVEDKFWEIYAPNEYLATKICKRDVHRKLWWAEICPFKSICTSSSLTVAVSME